ASFRTMISLPSVLIQVIQCTLSCRSGLTPVSSFLIRIESTFKAVSSSQKKGSLHFVLRIFLMQILRHHDRAVHVGQKGFVMTLIFGVGHNFPPFNQAHQKIWQRVPAVFFLQVVKLLLSTGELK